MGHDVFMVKMNGRILLTFIHKYVFELVLTRNVVMSIIDLSPLTFLKMVHYLRTRDTPYRHITLLLTGNFLLHDYVLYYIDLELL